MSRLLCNEFSDIVGFGAMQSKDVLDPFVRRTARVAISARPAYRPRLAKNPTRKSPP
jgi:hypothetical protein